MRRRSHCAWCHRPFTGDNPATVDHVLPLGRGGQDEPENAKAACQSCNGGRGATGHCIVALRCMQSIIHGVLDREATVSDIALCWNSFCNPTTAVKHFTGRTKKRKVQIEDLSHEDGMLITEYENWQYPHRG